jgi:hypothetical protein
VSFTISNHTTNAEDYQWLVTVTADNKPTAGGKGNVYLAPNGSTTINKNIGVVCKTGQAEVSVSLVGLNEHIDTWMTCH